MISKKDILTLDDDRKYQVLSIVKYDDQIYYYLMEIENEKIYEKDNIKILKQETSNPYELTYVIDELELDNIKNLLLSNLED